MAASLPSSARPVDPALTLGYNGRPQSFSHLAALALASDPARCSPYERLADLVEAVTKGWGGAEIDTRLDMPAMLFFLSIGSFFFFFFFFLLFFPPAAPCRAPWSPLRTRSPAPSSRR
jgi:hypothetical protein